MPDVLGTPEDFRHTDFINASQGSSVHFRAQANEKSSVMGTDVGHLFQLPLISQGSFCANRMTGRSIDAWKNSAITNEHDHRHDLSGEFAVSVRKVCRCLGKRKRQLELLWQQQQQQREAAVATATAVARSMI